MKTKYTSILILILISICARAAFEYIDYTTVQVPTTYTNYLVMTIPGVATNETVTIVTTNAIVGDSLPAASAKINSDFDWLNTNGTPGMSNVVLNYGGTLYQPLSTNLTGWSMLPTNLLTSGGGGSATNAIANLNGLGTNTSFFGPTYFLGSNLVVSAVSSNGLIPIMTASNLPSGYAYASGNSVSAFNAFPGGSLSVTSDPFWVAFETNVTANETIFNMQVNNSAPFPNNNIILLQASSDGVTWNTLASTNYYQSTPIFTTTFFTFYFPNTTASYWRWYIYGNANAPSPQTFSKIQLYHQALNVVSSTNALEFASQNGVAINTPTAGGYGLNVVGGLGADSITATTTTITTNNSLYIPNVTTADISDSGNADAATYSLAGTPINFSALPSLTNNIIQTYFITNCTDIATNYNGFFNFSSNGTYGAYWTNNSTGWVMIKGPTPSAASYLVTNATGAFSSVPIFLRNSGNVLGQWPYIGNEIGPGAGYAYYQPGDMPYVTAVITNLPQTFNGTFNGSFNSTLPHIPATVSVGGSPFSFTNPNPTALECYLTGTAAYSVSKNGVSIYGSLAGDAAVTLQSGSYLTVTFLSAPTMTTNAW